MQRVAVEREQALEAELRLVDAYGTRVETTFIDVCDDPLAAAGEDHIVVSAGFSLRPASTPARAAYRAGQGGAAA